MNQYDAVVVGGGGAVGAMITRLLVDDGLSVLVVDRNLGVDPIPGADLVHGDVLDPDADLKSTLGSAGIAVLTVPESVALHIPLTLFGSAALVVETLSVKTGFAAAAQDRSGPTLGINPMFAPSLGMPGRPVAAVVHRQGTVVDEFLTRLAEWGARVVEVDADTHDRLAAATQALTHASVLAFGAALGSLGVDPALVDAVAPPPARTALALLARISSGEPEVYWDVQAGNPYAAAARTALADGLRELDVAVASGSETDFAQFLTRAGASGPNDAAYRALCSDLFGIVRESRS